MNLAWLSHGSPATAALSNEETDEDAYEVEEDCLSPGRDDAEKDLQATSSPP